MSETAPLQPPADASAPSPTPAIADEQNELEKIKVEYITDAIIADWDTSGKEQLYAYFHVFYLLAYYLRI